MLNFAEITKSREEQPGFKLQNNNYARPEYNWRRVNRRNPCPVCGHREWCEVSDDGKTVHCMRVPGERAIDWRGGGWLHQLGVQLEPITRPASPRLPVSGPLPGDSAAASQSQALPESRRPSPAVSAAINWLLARLELSAEHWAYLEAEDLLDIAYDRLQYRTLPGEAAVRKALLEGLEQTFGREVVRDLGFVYERVAKGGGLYLEFAGVLRGVDALIIPVRALSGQPIALKARSVQPESGERLYRAMSAGNTERGVGIGTPIHVARPGQITPGLEQWLIVTEGEKKADYVAERLGVRVLGVQGVAAWRAGRLLPLVAQAGVKHIIEAFDADRSDTSKRGRENIERQARQLAEQCAAAAFTVYSARWPLAEGKGLDDFLRLQPANQPLRWPDLRRLKPITEKVGPEAEEPTEASSTFRRRYGLSLERAGRIANQFVTLDSDTLLEGRQAKARAKASQIFEMEASKTAAIEQASPLGLARLELARLFSAAFAGHVLSQGATNRRVLLRTTTGTGKTTAAQHEIIQHLSLGRPGRILYLTDTKQAYAHLFGRGGLLEAERQAGRVAIREGRSRQPGDYHCERLEDCSLLGLNRQPASADICSSCPFGSAANWLAQAREFGFDPALPRPFECEKSGYLASVRLSKAAQVVIAPKAALLNGSSELAEFDFIIIDEDTTGYLLECQELAGPQLDLWEAGRRRLENQLMLRGQEAAEPDEDEEDVPFELLRERHGPFDKLFGLVKAVLSEFELAGQSEAGRARFMPLVRARAEAEGLDLAALVAECYAVLPSRRFQRYKWEKPYHNRLTGAIIAPLRFARDLVELIERELASSPEGDTRLWLQRRAGATGGTVLVAYLPRRHLLDILNGQYRNYENFFGQPPTVFFLDATAGPIFRLALPQVEDLEIKVPQPLHVIQTTNSLYTGRSLQTDGGKALAKISRAADALIKRFHSSRPVIFSRKAFNPTSNGQSNVHPPGNPTGRSPMSNAGLSDVEEINSVPKLKVGGQSSASQTWDGPALDVGHSTLDTSSACRYGHYERHNKGLDDYADADLLVIVGHYSQPLDEIVAQVEAMRGRMAALPATEQTGNWRLKPYQWRGADGKGLARWCKAHPDPEIQAAIEHSTFANIMQTIGRGRAALRDKDKPLIVALFSSMPVAGLPIDELSDINDILEQRRISEKQAAALEAGRTAANAQRQAEAVARIEAAKEQLAASGQSFVAPGRFAKIAEVSRSTLYTLGYAQAGRWIRTGPIRDNLSLELFISSISSPASHQLE